MPQVSHGVKVWAFIKRLWKESASKHIQIVGIIQFHLAVGCKSPFPCCLWVRDHPKHLDSGQIPSPSIFKASNSGSSLLTLETCSLLPHHSSATLFYHIF